MCTTPYHYHHGHFVQLCFFFGGDSTLSGRALGWLNRFPEHSLNDDYNDYKNVLLMSWFYLLETNSTCMRMCRLRMYFFDVMVLSSPLRMITTCELITDEEDFFEVRSHIRHYVPHQWEIKWSNEVLS